MNVIKCLSIVFTLLLTAMLSASAFAEEATSEEATDTEVATEATTVPEVPDVSEVKEEKSDKENESSYSIGEVVITAAKDEEEPFLTNRSVDIITRKEISERQPRTVPEALRESPGVFVQETNFGGGSPIIRGLVGPQILLLMDGVRLNNSVFRTGPLQYLNLVDNYQVEQIEVVRGPGSVLYGSDALGATINTLTIQPVDRRERGFGWGGKIAGKYGSAAREKTVHAGLDLGHSIIGTNVSASFKDFDDIEGGRGVGTQPHSSYSQVNAAANVVARLENGFVKDWQFSLGYRLAKMIDTGRSEKYETKSSYNIYQNDHHLVYAKAQMKFKPILTNLDLTLSYQNFFEQKDTFKEDDTKTFTKAQVQDEIGVHTVGVDAKFNTKAFDDRLSVVYGTEFYHDTVDSSRIEQKNDGKGWSDGKYTPYPEGSKYYLVGAYAMVNGEVFPKTSDIGLKLTGGYRFQQMGGVADAREDAPAVDYSNNAHVMMAGIQGSYKRNWTSAFTFSQGFRSPNLQESVQVGDTGSWYHVANHELGPERSDTIELVNRFKAWKMYGSVSGYISFLKDVIKRVPAEYEGQTEVLGIGVVENVNGGKGRIYGAEAQIGYDIIKGLSLHSSIAYTYGVEYLTDEAKANDDKNRSEVPLSRIPPLFGDVKLRWKQKFTTDIKWFIETYIQYAAKQDRISDRDIDDVRIPEDGTPSWVTWNMRSGLDMYNIASFVLTIENLTNTKYKYHGSGVYGAGTNAILSLELRYF